MRSLFKRYYVYVHLRGDTGEPFYYGKGKGGRAWERDRNLHHDRIVAKYGMKVVILKEGLTNEEAKLEEIRQIKEARIRGEKLTNQTDGGDEVGGESSRRGGNKTMALKIGLFDPKHKSKGPKVAGMMNAKNKTGVCGRSKEKMVEDGKIGGVAARDKGLGVHARSKEQMSIDGKKGGEKSKYALAIKYKCGGCEYVGNSGNLSKHQKSTGHIGKTEFQ